MNTTYLCLGSNVGNKEANIADAVRLLEKKVKITKLSALYKTEPLDYEQQDFFLNQVVEAETELSLEELFKAILSVERTLGKNISIRFGPRNIDIDILFYNDSIANKQIAYNKDSFLLQVPHPRLHTRKFVLMPLAEIAHGLMHPLIKRNIKQLLDNLDKSNKSKKVERLHQDGTANKKQEASSV